MKLGQMFLNGSIWSTGHCYIMNLCTAKLRRAQRGLFVAESKENKLNGKLCVLGVCGEHCFIKEFFGYFMDCASSQSLSSHFQAGMALTRIPSL